MLLLRLLYRSDKTNCCLRPNDNKSPTQLLIDIKLKSYFLIKYFFIKIT